MSKRKNVIDMARSVPVGDAHWMEKFLQKLFASEPEAVRIMAALAEEKGSDAGKRQAQLQARL